MRPRDITGSTDSKDFTSESEEDEGLKGGTHDSDEEDQENLVLLLNDDREKFPERSCTKGKKYPAWVLDAKLSQLG